MTRADQGLPPKIEDDAVLEAAAVILLDRGGDRRGPPGRDETGRPPAKTDAQGGGGRAPSL
jgi:hypothetical protein